MDSAKKQPAHGLLNSCRRSPRIRAVESDRCLYCYDAPCTHACHSHRIPRFIKKIASGNLRGSAATIFARICWAQPARGLSVQELCEGACVLGSDHKPIAIGRLQRYAMDYAYGVPVFQSSKRRQQVDPLL